MGEAERPLRFEIPREDAGAFIACLEATEAGESASVAIVPFSVPDQPAAFDRIGLDRRLKSELPDATIIAVAVAGGSVVKAIAAAVIEFIRSRRVSVRYHRADGSFVEFTGSTTPEAIEQLILHDASDSVPSSGEASADA